MAANTSIGGAKKLKSKDFMVADKPATTQAGCEEVKVKEELDEDAPDGTLRLCEKAPDASRSSDKGLKMSMKAEGKRLIEVTHSLIIIFSKPPLKSFK